MREPVKLYTFEEADFPVRAESPTRLLLTNNSPFSVTVLLVWSQSAPDGPCMVRRGDSTLASLKPGESYVFKSNSVIYSASFYIRFSKFIGNAPENHTVDYNGGKRPHL